jgi:hypothetical protein
MATINLSESDIASDRVNGISSVDDLLDEMS